MAVLAKAHNAEVDRQVIGVPAGPVSTWDPRHVGITSVTNTDASPTAQELWPRLVHAVRQIPTQRLTTATHPGSQPTRLGLAAVQAGHDRAATGRCRRLGIRVQHDGAFRHRRS
jgi:hypothetical protein